MSPVTEMLEELKAVDAEAQRSSDSDSWTGVIERMLRHTHRVAQMLQSDATKWITPKQAMELLDVRSANTVKTWARHSLLEHRTHNGRMQLSLDSVLRRKQTDDDLLASTDLTLSDAEMDVVSRTRPGNLPWQREP